MSRFGIEPHVRPLLAVVPLALAVGAALAQPAAPPPPARYDVTLRYRITSPRDQHVAVYDAMIDRLRQQGFEFVPPLDKLPKTDREDPTKELLTGTVPSDRFLKLLELPHVESLLLTPPGFKMPAAPDAPILVRLELASGFTPGRQAILADQTQVLLREIGFVEGVGYDHRGYTGRPHTRLVGTIPADQLPLLLQDLRNQPSGWLGPRILPADLPPPLRETTPVVVTEILPGAVPPTELTFPPPRGAADLNKIADDLWALVAGKATQDEVVRLEVILAYTPDDRDRSWQDALTAAAPSLFVEGRLGAYVTGLARAGQARGLAALPLVSVVRLARPPRVAVDPGVRVAADNARALGESGLTALHRRGFRGRGVRVVVIDGDFHGHEELISTGRLPAGTRHVDLTAQRSAELFPDPLPPDPKRLGHGTRCALALALAAPEAELTLLRIDPAAPHMLREAAAYLNGEPVTSAYLELRRDELVVAANELKARRAALLAERRRVLEAFEDEADFDRQFGILGPVGAWLYSARRWHALRLAEFERDEQRFRQRELRYLRLMEDLLALRGTHVVSCSLAWADGYPLGGSSPLSRWFDDFSRYRALWFQSAGNTGGQTWAGPFRDDDGNGAMEFAGPGAMPPGRWTRELNFLGWRPFGGDTVPDLPAGVKARVAVQWREPHDPDYFIRPGEEDRYRIPLAELRLIVLRQRDPAGKALPADALDVVAVSYGTPRRLDNQPNRSTYEMAVEFPIAKDGRYAVRLERQVPARWTLLVDPRSGREWVGQVSGLTPTGLRPLGVATLPALEKRWELSPRLFVTVADDAAGGKGQVVFLDFPTTLGNVGMPGDARSLVTVGAADLAGRPEPYSAKGPPPNLENLLSPDVFAYDRLDLGKDQAGVAFGTSLATPFAAGLAASRLSAGTTRDQFLSSLPRRPGGLLTIPR